MSEDTVRTLEALSKATLEEIENDQWGPAPDDTSYLIRRCHELRTVPLGQFGPEDLRILIGQHIGLDVLVPLAAGMLRTDPFVGGDHYPGDLLAAVLRVPEQWFARHPPVAAALDQVVATLDEGATDDVGVPLLDDTDLTQLLAAWRARMEDHPSMG